MVQDVFLRMKVAANYTIFLRKWQGYSKKTAYFWLIIFFFRIFVTRFFSEKNHLYLYIIRYARTLLLRCYCSIRHSIMIRMIQCRNRRCSELFCLEFCSVLCLRLSFSSPYRFCCAERYRVLQAAGTCCWLHAEILRRWFTPIMVMMPRLPNAQYNRSAFFFPM